MTSAPWHVRPEQDGDVARVRAILERAFDTPAEADLVDDLRRVARPLVALVAERDGVVAGHVLFTPVTVRDGSRTWRAMGLAPLAVDPDLQRTGAGAALVRAGLAACVDLGETVVFVLGHDTYYPRFGFAPAEPRLRYKDLECGPSFMVAELVSGALGEMAGRVDYHPEFDRFG